MRFAVCNLRFQIRRGRMEDYAALERFHYRPGRPATCAGVFVVRYRGRTVAAAVLSYPTLNLDVRQRVLKLSAMIPGRRIGFINRQIRTISRVAVHPTFRSLGLAARLVRYILDHCETRYVEAMAIMGRVHPFFQKAGMSRYEPDSADKPVYFLFDRGSVGSPAPGGE